MQRMSIISLFATTIFALTLSGCSGVNQTVAAAPAAAVAPKLTADRPRDVAFNTGLKKELSTLNLLIEASSDDIARSLNQSLRKELYKGATGTRGLSANVVRNGPVTVSAADNFIYFTLPVSMTLGYSLFETQAIPLKLKFKASARITPDWQLATDIYYVGLSDLLAEQIGVGPISIKPRSIVEGVTQPVQQVVSGLISNKINEVFPLKGQIAKAWNAAQKPVLVDRNYGAWLKLNPREVMLSPLYAGNNRIKLAVGINTFAELVVGPQPAALPPVPLPNLKQVDKFDRSFRIALNTDLHYTDILKIAAPLLLNKEFESDGKTVVIKGLDLYGNGDRLVVRIETAGSLEGVFYLTGKPRFDTGTNIFSMDEVDFDMQTQSLLLQSADWFLHGTIKSRIQEKLTVDLTQRVAQTRDMAGKAISQVQLVDHVLLKGSIKNLKFSDMLVQKEKVSIQVYSDGESTVLFR